MTYTSRKFGERVQKRLRVCSERLKTLLVLARAIALLQAVPSSFPSWLHWLTPRKKLVGRLQEAILRISRRASGIEYLSNAGRKSVSELRCTWKPGVACS